MPAPIAWGRWFAMTSVILAGGYGLMSATVPTEKDLYNKLSPELKREMDKIVRQREGSASMKDRLLDAGEKDEVIWGEQLGNKGGYGGSRR